MKKTLSFVLTAIMVMSLGITSFAAGTNTHELIYQNTASYEISIPASSNIDIATGKGAISVAVTEAKLEDSTAIAITASSPNYSNGTWNLVNAKNSNDKISYTIGTTEGGSDVVSGNEVISTKEAATSTLYVTLSDTSRVGTFTDTITFTSEIVSTLISFTIEGSSYQADKDMTWEDWANSIYNTDGRFGVINTGSPLLCEILNNGNAGYLIVDENGENLWLSDLVKEGNYVSDRSGVEL